jgi:hypothetical protein
MVLLYRWAVWRFLGALALLGLFFLWSPPEEDEMDGPVQARIEHLRAFARSF